MSGRATLRDGAAVVIRPIEPEDREAIVEGFERLSPESRYRRFFGPMATFNRPDRERKAGSIGLPVRGVEIELVDVEPVEPRLVPCRRLPWRGEGD